MEEREALPMDSNIREFYLAVREDEELLEQLLATADADDLMATVLRAGAELGFSLTENDIRAGLDAIDALVAEVSNDDELNDFELARVSGGGQTKVE